MRAILCVTTALALLVSGCADDEYGRPNKASAPKEDTGTLVHVDGTVALDGEQITVTPRSGTAVELEIGKDLPLPLVQAMATSQELARVYYRDGKDPVAVRVEKFAPGNQAKSDTGAVDEVTDTTLTVDTDAAEPLRLTIRPEDAEGFDVEHLKEHKAEKSQIKVYYETVDGTSYALAYEDA